MKTIIEKTDKETVTYYQCEKCGYKYDKEDQAKYCESHELEENVTGISEWSRVKRVEDGSTGTVMSVKYTSFAESEHTKDMRDNCSEDYFGNTEVHSIYMKVRFDNERLRSLNNEYPKNIRLLFPEMSSEELLGDFKEFIGEMPEQVRKETLDYVKKRGNFKN